MEVRSNDALVTRRKDRSLVLAVWSLVNPGDTGADRDVVLKFEHLGKSPHALLSRVDSAHGDIHAAYQKMGSPRYPTQGQLKQLRQASELAKPEKEAIHNNEIKLHLPINGLVLVEIR